MLICLLRHGVAEDASPDTGYADAPRRLTDDGVRKMHEEARGIELLDLGIATVIHSPLVRCAQTAAIVAEQLNVPSREHPALRPGAESADVLGLAEEHPDTAAVLFCGHEPDMSQITHDLTAGGWVEFKKGTLAVIEIPEGRRSGWLRALYPPRALRLLGGGT